VFIDAITSISLICEPALMGTRTGSTVVPRNNSFIAHPASHPNALSGFVVAHALNRMNGMVLVEFFESRFPAQL
jgi:hypothetical protein